MMKELMQEILPNKIQADVLEGAAGRPEPDVPPGGPNEKPELPPEAPQPPAELPPDHEHVPVVEPSDPPLEDTPRA